MVLLSRIYTKSGDKGTTSLGDGTRIHKSSFRIDAIGNVDESNASLGLCRLYTKENHDLDTLLIKCQNDLFDVGADLCVPSGDGLRINAHQVSFLETTIDFLNENLSPLHSFILPGGSPLSTYLHLARTVTRRAERSIASLMQREEEINPLVLQYLNRLSDLLFVMSRYANSKGQTDVLWVPGANR